MWSLRRPRFQDMPQISSTTWCEIQTFGFVNANILLIKIGDVWEREVNPKMAEEIKDGGESSWWQGDCKPNRTHTLTAILAESAMNKEKGREERLSEHQFSLLVICDCHELYIIWLLGIRMYCRGSHINRGGRSSLWLWNCDNWVYSADQLAQFGAPQGLTRLIALETFSKLIVKTGGYQQLAQISERESSRELYPIRHRQNKKARYSY